MPPRKKIVKKTVRKATSKTPTQTLTEEPTTASETLTAGLSATKTLREELTADETLTEKPTASETLMESMVTETLIEEPAAAETVIEEPAFAETLVEEPAGAETLTVASAATEILIEEPAATKTPIEELKATETVAEEMAAETLVEKSTAIEIQMEERAATETSQEPLETAKKTKTVTRVRRVLKKKIVKKLVPKTPKVAQEVDKIEEAAMVVINSSEEKREMENPSSDDAPKVENAMEEGEKEVGGDDESGISERRNRKKTEIFIGGLDRDAKEEDLRKIFRKVGEIVEVRMIMNGQSGKNKGYAFIRYADASQAKKAVAQFEKVEVCGKLCGASALKGNDTIFLGNIDKKWKKEDIIKLLKEVGIEKIEDVNVMPDPDNADSNRGFAFLELETNKDAHNAYKKLQKNGAFGKGLNVKVSWAEPLNDPDEEEMKKVKSVYVEGIPASWNEEKVRESFKKFGEIERIVLARNMNSAKRKDFAFVNYKTREGAVSCIESFDKEDLTGNGSKVNVKVSLAKPVQKGKQNRGTSTFNNKKSTKEKPKAVQRDTKTGISSSMGKSSLGGYTSSHGTKSSRPHEFMHVSRDQGTWKQGPVGYARDPTTYDYTYSIGGKRPFSSLGDEHLYSDIRAHPCARLDSYPASSSRYGARSGVVVRSSHPYFQHLDTGYASGANHQRVHYPATHQMNRGGAPPYGNDYYSRY